MEAIGKKIEKWITNRLTGIDNEIEEVRTYINRCEEDEAWKATNPDKYARYKLMLACRLHTRGELETMKQDLSSLFEIE